VLFLDDNALNVAGAAAAGFQATRASGVGEARQRLAEAGVLSAAAGPKVSAADGSPWAIPASVARSVIEEDDRAMRNRP
jgi:hypothetical protein